MSGSDVNCDGTELLEIETEKVLGISWDMKDDQFFYTVKIHFFPNYMKVHSMPNLLYDELDSKFATILTRHMVISQVASVFDPLGLIQSFTLFAKFLMKGMIMNGRGL